MLTSLKRLGPGAVLIMLASGILLATDSAGRSGRLPRVAIVQHISTAVFDDGVKGAIAGLAERGFRDGDTVRLTQYNAQGDFATANDIARQILFAGDYQLVITISTTSLQTVANANKHRQLPLVFGLVADPPGADVGIDRANPKQHPSYMVGYGNFLPVDESFRVARQMNTSLSKVGCVWNNAESNSEAYTHKAREVCRDLGITLLEANVNSSADVQEAAQSLVGRGARAIWVGGDATVLSALDSVLAVARKASIPVFSILPGKPERGTLFDVGVDFFEVGRRTGILAADVLSGTDPASLPIVDVLDRVPRRLLINQQALRDLTDTWRIPDALLRQAEVVVDEQGVPKKKK